MRINQPHGTSGMHFLTAVCLTLCAALHVSATARAQAVADLAPQPFGDQFPKLDSDAVGEWWKPGRIEGGKNNGQLQEPRLLVPRDQVVAFALYTHDHGILKLSAQLYSLKPDEPQIVVASLSCNSSRTPGSRATIVDNLKKLDPDLLFFAGDQSYHHTQHTFGWLEWGMQFREILRMNRSDQTGSALQDSISRNATSRLNAGRDLPTSAMATKLSSQVGRSLWQ